MRQVFILANCLFFWINMIAQTNDQPEINIYKKNDLGLRYSNQSSLFKVWSPVASAMELRLYEDGDGLTLLETQVFKKEKNGLWIVEIKKDLKGKFYTYRAKIDSNWKNEVVDPYAKAVGINGKRAMVIDLKDTNPESWDSDINLEALPPTDAIIYELNIRDASSSPTSNIQQRGKFLGLAETGTKNAQGLSTGIDHIKELGFTHVHLMPFFDFNSIDEKNEHPTYNWGYDPLNYNVPEGSLSTNPYNGITRIKELKKMILAFHQNGLRVVMDVVYNHTALTEISNFNQLVPNYYYRHTADGKFSNATACGNETASERFMFRKFMTESLSYWLTEYHLDGFRFDLMGVHDIETMNEISATLNKIKPGLLLYGEGWTANPSPFPDSLRALKANVSLLKNIAVFSDDIRDGIKGSVFDFKQKGFVSGNTIMTESVKFGIVGCGLHLQINYDLINYSKKYYTNNPAQVINYASCHDNHTLWDKLSIAAQEADEYQRMQMQKLALSIVLTSQGIPFLHAGSEFLRSKKGLDNSYESPDNINAIDWSLKTKNYYLVVYVHELIALRKAHPAFRMKTSEAIANNIVFRDNVATGVISYTINGAAVGDDWKLIQVFFNGTAIAQKIFVANEWKAAITSNTINQNESILGKDFVLEPFTCSILYQ